MQLYTASIRFPPSLTAIALNHPDVATPNQIGVGVSLVGHPYPLAIPSM